MGAQVVVNGDFYATGPTRVYGRAVGGGVPWPLDQTGADPAYAGELRDAVVAELENALALCRGAP